MHPPPLLSRRTPRLLLLLLLHGVGLAAASALPPTDVDVGTCAGVRGVHVHRVRGTAVARIHYYRSAARRRVCGQPPPPLSQRPATGQYYE